MNLYPAIDLKDNKCVRLTKGRDDTSEVFNENPLEQAKFFQDNGLVFVGMDVIGGYCTEINITSPTGLVHIKNLGGEDLSSNIITAAVAP